ncbi:MAG: hypothetical protein AAFX50_00710 [Acidobacteriota bacterium]
MDKLWSKTEISHLKRNAASQTLEDLAERFHTDTETVRVKMEELGLVASPSSAGSTDVMTEHFTKGVEALYGDDLDAAIQHFETVANQAEGRQLRDRASQYLEICRKKQAGADPVEDLYLAAVMAKNRGDLEGALEFAAQGDAGDEKFAYITASLQAMAGDEEAAIEALTRAIELEPRNRVYAYHDPDFRDLREAESFSTLLRAQTA